MYARCMWFVAVLAIGTQHTDTVSNALPCRNTRWHLLRAHSVPFILSMACGWVQCDSSSQTDLRHFHEYTKCFKEFGRRWIFLYVSIIFKECKKTICMMVFWLFKKMCTFLFPLPIPEEEMFVKCYVRV